MEDNLKLPVHFEGRDYEFEIRIVPYGYIYRMLIRVEGAELIFEMDEERNYRVLENPEELVPTKHIKPELVQAIINQLKSLHD